MSNAKEAREKLKHVTLARIQELEHDLSKLRAELRKKEEDLLDTAKVRRDIFKLADYRANPPSWTVRAARRKHSAGIPILFASDIHAGEVVRPSEMNNLNEYNLEICEARFRRLIARTIDLCSRHMGETRGYPGIIFALGGDMTSGDIHRELTRTNEKPTYPTLFVLFDLLVWGINTLLKHFGRVFIPSVPGNHGEQRLDSHKPSIKSYAHTNADWLLYTMLEKHFAGNPNVKFLVPEDNDARFQVFDMRIMLTHGNAIGAKGGDGMIGAIGPIARGTVMLQIQAASMHADCDMVMMGHWHRFYDDGRALINGTIKGHDEYAARKLRAPYSPPFQVLFFIHPEWGRTATWRVWLDDNQVKRQPGEWVSVYSRGELKGKRT